MAPSTYFAFISYTRSDEHHALRLHEILESYKVPSFLREIHPDIPESLTPVFIDTLDLKLGVLSEAISYALEHSNFLINICSKSTPASKWVGYELATFAEKHGVSKIIPFLVEGTPGESYHSELKALHKQHGEFLAANANERDFEYAAVKTIAYMLELEVSEVWNRHQKAVQEEKRRLLEEKHRLQRAESRYIAEKVLSLYDQGDLHFARRLSLFGLPADIYNPDRPLVWQMEAAFRRLSFENQVQYKGYDVYDACSAFNDVNISPDGRYIAAAARNEVVYLWETATGKMLYKFPHDNELWCAAFSNDSKKLATGSREHFIRIWSLEDGTCEVLTGHGGSIHSLKFSSDDSLLVSASYDATVKVWDVRSRKCLRTISDFTSSVSNVDISRDGTYMLTRSFDAGFQMWESGKCVLQVPSRSVARGLFSNNVDFCVIPQLDKVQIWGIADKCCEDEISFNGHLRDIDLSADGRRLMILTDKELAIWDLLSNKCIYTYGKFGRSCEFCRFTPLGQYLLLASSVSLWLHNLSEGSLVSFDNQESCRCSCVADDDSVIAVTDYDGVNFWNVADGQIECRIPMDASHTVISRDGKTLVFADSDNNVVAVDVQTKEARSIGSHGDSVNAILMTSDQTKVLTSSSDGTVKVWDVVADTCLKTIDFTGKEVYGMAFCPGEKSLLAAAGTSLFMIDIADLSSSPVLIGENTPSVYSLAVSHNGKYACTLEFLAPEVRLWDLENKVLLDTFYLSERATSLGVSVVFSADDRNFIVSTDEGDMLIFGVEHRGLLLDMKAHDCEIAHMAFMPDGRRIITSDDNGVVKIWPFLPLQELIDQTAARYADYPLTRAEKKDLYIEE